MMEPQPHLEPVVRLVDQDGRQLIRYALDRTLVVEAAAGTGKTTELVHRMINVLAQGLARVDQIVAVTFTEKAAGELKLRLRSGLEKARQTLGSHVDSQSAVDQLPVALRRHNLEQALAHLEEAHVSTIHGFCAELLRERPVEAGIDPGFEVLIEPEAERLYGQAFDLWLQETLEDPPEGVRRSLRRISRFRRRSAAGAGADDPGPTSRLRRAGWDLVQWRDFPRPWRRDRFDRKREILALVSEVHQFAELTRNPAKTTDPLHHATRPARQLSDTLRRSEVLGAIDLDRTEAQLVHLAGDYPFRTIKRGYGSSYRQGLARDQVLSAHKVLISSLQRFERAADADLAACLHGELGATINRYERLKTRGGKLDFVDLLVRARDLVRDHQAVRHAFQRRFTHVFVDEFQDTDPLQAEILLLITAADPSVSDWWQVTPVPGKLFTVGDPKQSIYRFRRADVSIYQEVKEQLIARGATHVLLTTSFRSLPAIQRAVNRAFASLMTGDRQTLQADYVALSPYRADVTDQPSLIALSVPRPYGFRGVTLRAIEQSLPDAVGAFVDWLINQSGWTIAERESPSSVLQGGEHRGPVSARHICLLFRRFEKFGEDMTRRYVEALEARGIPHLLVGGKSFHAREEVATMRAALAAVEWPDDELSVFATLRGSLFAIDDETLLLYRHRCGRLHPFRVPPELQTEGARPAPSADSPPTGDELVELLPVVEALTLLRQLHGRRNYVPVTETIGRLLDATRAHAGFVMRPSGEQVLANVLQIAELARQYETGGGSSFRGFVERLQEEAETGEASEAPILEEGSDGVRIMTVHRAKGLEFPVVILADITAGLARDDAGRYIDAEQKLCALRIGGWSPADLRDHEPEEVGRDRAEGIRIAYVAATRARDLLVVPAVGDGPLDGRWVSPLNEAIYPAPDRRRSPEPAPGCPEFGKDSVLERPGDEEPLLATLAPGLHRVGGDHGDGPDTRSFPVVWWDPSTLELGVEAKFGLRQEALIGKDAPEEVVQADLTAYRAWRALRQATTESGALPSLAIQTVTQRSAEAEGALPGVDEVSIVEIARHAPRPGGLRFGTLVHTTLATVPLEANQEGVVEVASLQARILGATDEETTAAAEMVSAALQHPILQRARRAAGQGACRRETPVTFVDRDGTMIEGAVDLAFLDHDTWTIVDFKTDQELKTGLDTYRRQVKLYADIVARATGQPARAVLMRV